MMSIFSRLLGSDPVRYTEITQHTWKTLSEKDVLNSDLLVEYQLERFISCLKASGPEYFRDGFVIPDGWKESYHQPWIWREIAAKGCVSILDIGGSFGVHYFNFSKKFGLEEIVRWDVLELEQVCAHENSLRSLDMGKKLQFFSSFSKLQPQYDVIIASSVLQYVPSVETFLRDVLDLAAGVVLIERTPTSDTEIFFNQRVNYGSFSSCGPMRPVSPKLLIRWAAEYELVVLDSAPSHVDKGAGPISWLNMAFG